LAEKELGKKIKALRGDNGGEYVSQEFKDFCVAEGSKRELTNLITHGRMGWPRGRT